MKSTGSGVGDLAHSPRAVPVPITGDQGGVDEVIGKSLLVENILPEGSNWDGQTGLLVDEKTFKELVGRARRSPSRVSDPSASRISDPSLRSLMAAPRTRLRITGLVLAGMGMQASGAELPPLEPGLDYHSYANIDQFRVTHLELDLRVDLDLKSISGTVALDLKRLDPGATQLVLDTKDLMINDVSQKATDVLGATAKNQTLWVSRPFHLEKPDPILGSALVIDLPPSRKSVEYIRIDYETQPEAGALQWLTKKQTAGGHKAFLYTQSEPIGTRTWIPLQDTPQVRATYKAQIHTDDDVLAVMSAENDPKAKRNGEYSFVMPQAIPSYLIALAVGDLVFKETGTAHRAYMPRSR